MEKIIFAGGCFWGVEEYFSRIRGVIQTKVGYANGSTENPTYNEVCHQNTGHVEACQITYDANLISLEELLNKFWQISDPTLLNRQGHDVGRQYRTGIYYYDEEDIFLILKTLDEQKKKYSKPIVTEVQPVINFCEAEEYHQRYLKKNPGGYCHIKLKEE